MSDTPLTKRAYNLGLKAVPNFEALDEARIKYFESHLDQIPGAIERGFVLLGQSVKVEEAPVSVVYKTADTDLGDWLVKAQDLAREFFGVDVNLFQHFAIPEVIPWPSAIPVFDPGGLTNRNMVKRAFKDLGLSVYEEVDVMSYDGAEANKSPTLQLIANSIKPDAWTLTNPGTSPNQLLATGRRFLRLRSYGLAFALRKFVKNDYLDPETWTWFPEDRLPDGLVANGRWHPDTGEVGFYGFRPGYRHPPHGARVAISCGSLVA